MRTRHLVVLSCLLLLVAACTDSGDPIRPAEPSPLDISIDIEPAALTTDCRVTVTVTATNVSDAPVSLGPESEYCAVGAVVRIEGADHAAGRNCYTDDWERILAPGETWSESWYWTGWYRPEEDGEAILLAPGVYEVRGSAAGWTGEPTTLTVREDLPPEERASVKIEFEPPALTLGDSVLVTVTTENLTDMKILLGFGCIFPLGVVEIEGAAFLFYEPVICPMDVAPRYLDPGEITTRAWYWQGQIRERFSSTAFDIEPGTYSVRGVFGQFEGQAVVLEVTNPDQVPDARYRSTYR